MYVDDVFGVTLRKHLEHDMAVSRKALTDLLGDDAVSDPKSAWGRILDIIGWRIDLNGMHVTISRKNLLNAFYAFYSVDLESKSSLRTLQRLASLGCRYSLVCPAMRPFSTALYQHTAGCTDKNVQFSLSPAAKLSVIMWRAMFFLMSQHETRYARSLQSFRPAPTRICLRTDASLSGAGGYLFYRDKSNGAETVTGSYATDLIPLGFGVDSSYQNAAEFIGIVMGLVALRKMGLRDIDICISGDSMSALKWANDNTFKSATVSNASVVFTLVCLAFGFHVCEAEHVSGVDNWKADRLSRLAEGASLEATLEQIGFRGVPVIQLADCPHSGTLLAACKPNPGGIAMEAKQFTEFWSTIRIALHGLDGNPASHSWILSQHSNGRNVTT